MNAMGFSAKPQSKRGSKFLCKNGQILRKSSSFGSSAKKEERGHKVLSSNNNLLLLRIRAQNIIYNLY